MLRPIVGEWTCANLVSTLQWSSGIF